jgi:hypothetical protein
MAGRRTTTVCLLLFYTHRQPLGQVEVGFWHLYESDSGLDDAKRRQSSSLSLTFHLAGLGEVL